MSVQSSFPLYFSRDSWIAALGSMVATVMSRMVGSSNKQSSTSYIPHDYNSWCLEKLNKIYKTITLDFMLLQLHKEIYLKQFAE